MSAPSAVRGTLVVTAIAAFAVARPAAAQFRTFVGPTQVYTGTQCVSQQYPTGFCVTVDAELGFLSEGRVFEGSVIFPWSYGVNYRFTFTQPQPPAIVHLLPDYYGGTTFRVATGSGPIELFQPVSAPPISAEQTFRLETYVVPNPFSLSDPAASIELVSGMFHVGEWVDGGRPGEGPYEPTIVVPFTRVTATPEPATLALLGTGLLAIGAWVRRRA